MKSSSKIIEASKADLAVEEWIPNEVGDAFALGVSPSIEADIQPNNGDQPLEQAALPTSGLDLSPGDSTTEMGWTPPEIDLSGADHVVGLYYDRSSEQYQQEHDLANIAQRQKMVSNAELKMSQLIQHAENQAQQICAEAHKQGLAAAYAEVDQLLRTSRSIADEMHAWRESMIAQSEETIINLVLDIGRTLFGSGFVLDNNKIKEVYIRAIRDAKNLGNLVIRLHPDDVDLIDGRWLQEQTNFGQNVKLAADSSIKRGGCFIEGEYGQVDARIDTQFAAITDKLTDVLAAKSAHNYSNQPDTPEEPSGKLPDNFGI